MSGRQDKWQVDLFAKGSCIYRLDERGEVESMVAWARSSIVASRAFEALVFHNPTESFSQRRRAVVENERVAPAPLALPAAMRPVIQSAHTIADHLDGGYAIRAYCERPGEPRCGHSVRLDLEAVGKRLGFEQSCLHVDLVPKLRCSACGSRQVSLRISPMARQGSG